MFAATVVCFLVFIASQHTLHQLRLQLYTTTVICDLKIAPPLTVPRCYCCCHPRAQAIAASALDKQRREEVLAAQVAACEPMFVFDDTAIAAALGLSLNELADLNAREAGVASPRAEPAYVPCTAL